MSGYNAESRVLFQRCSRRPRKRSRFLRSIAHFKNGVIDSLGLGVSEILAVAQKVKQRLLVALYLRDGVRHVAHGSIVGIRSVGIKRGAGLRVNVHRGAVPSAR